MIWKTLLKDAQDSVETAELLFEHNKFGKAAFHAQQSVELSIKAYVVYFNLVKDRQNSLFKTHIPSKILLKDLLSEIIESLNKINLRNMDELIRRLTNMSYQKLENTKRLMKKVDKDKELLKELWKVSLGIQTDESRITEFFHEIEQFKKTTFPFELLESTIVRMRGIFQTIFEKLRKERKSHVIERIKRESSEQSVNRGIPYEITNILFSNETGKDLYNTIKNNSSFADNFDLIDCIYGKDGLLDLCSLISGIKEESLSRNEREATLRMYYLAHLSEIVLFTYPHEELGRYSEIIDGKSVETWYEERKIELKKIIDTSRLTFDRTKSLLMQY